MNLVYCRIYPDFWQRMLQYTDQMEDICSFAQISRYFYRVTNIDFQKLCYRNMICRFEDETWATAFSQAWYRTTSEYAGRLVNVQLINKSTQLLLDMQITYIVYDLRNKCVVNVYYALPKQRYSTFTLYYSNGTLVDLLNQKEYKVETIKLQFLQIHSADVFGYRRYVGFVNPRREFVVIDNETGKMNIIFQTQSSFYDIWLFDDIGHVRIPLC
ncbi:unnamed protein product [Bursaphelenchus okinawaensis]|uniref:Uncharacterized protein n=1 Tax=Bursaphelenchus okinawaensis TaxID=465554 RepID=A0A811LFD8_9BILA|nr:unnamed protein product [Bursaphelenchus okinawaensis]CAG9121411.1 unnamed protein product [Bursaphelenchus okinawaensis]